LIKSFSPTVDTSIGDYKEPAHLDDEIEQKKIVDNRLEMIQNEDQGKNFSDIMKNAEDNAKSLNLINTENKTNNVTEGQTDTQQIKSVVQDPVYKVFIGSYTSADQARVAKEIIQESGSGLNPIVKCIGTNNYTLQVGIFKSKQSAESMLYTVQQSNLPGRIVQDY
jgi:cell division protein FtsN